MRLSWDTLVSRIYLACVSLETLSVVYIPGMRLSWECRERLQRLALSVFCADSSACVVKRVVRSCLSKATALERDSAATASSSACSSCVLENNLKKQALTCVLKTS